MTAAGRARRPGRTRVKICGIRSAEMALAAAEAGADAIGLVVEVRSSPRSVSMEEALRIAESLPKMLMSVAVMQDPPESLVRRWPGSWLQLHGSEDEALVASVARAKHVVKGFRFDPQEVLRWNACADVDVLLVDGSAGGAGLSFNHRALAGLMPGIDKPVILAGGLTAANVADAIGTVRPFGVDVSSGVESTPGVKDPQLIRSFCEAVRAADAG